MWPKKPPQQFSHGGVTLTALIHTTNQRANVLTAQSYSLPDFFDSFFVALNVKALELEAIGHVRVGQLAANVVDGLIDITIEAPLVR